jgi:DNA-binding GntR family transcriptional regulator
MRLEKSAGIHYQTKQDLVYSTLRHAIMHCEVMPGARLVIEEIAQQLSVSPIPVREALHLLQSEGLVEMTPHVGAIVAPIAPSAITEIFTILEGLEVVATRTAAQRISSANLAELSAINQEMDEVLERQAFERWPDLNSKFHRTISSFTGMQLLQEMTHRIFDRWDRVRRYYFSDVLLHRLDVAQQEHRAILEAMRARNYAELERLIKLHNQGALISYTAYIETKEA